MEEADQLDAGTFVTEEQEDTGWCLYEDDNEVVNPEEPPIIEDLGHEEFGTENTDGIQMVYHEEDDEDDAGAPDDLASHNLALREYIDEAGIRQSTYFCQECSIEYTDINDFLQQHPGVDLLNEDEVEGAAIEETERTNSLWDLVEEVPEEDDPAATEQQQICSNEIKTENTAFGEGEMVKQELDDESTDRYFCYECKRMFSDLKTAEEHDCTQNEEDAANKIEVRNAPNDDQTMYTCNYCNKLCSSHDDVVQHLSTCELNNNVTLMMSSSDVVVYHCTLCNKDYNTYRAYCKHEKMHKKSGNAKPKPPSEPITCDICNTHFASRKNLKLHMKIHDAPALKSIQQALPAGAQSEYNELSQFYCEICNKSFDQRLISIHKNMHQNVGEYNCGRCNKQFENSLSYEMHLQMHNEKDAVKNTANNGKEPTLAPSDSSKQHMCQYCGKEFARPYEKVKHERVHTGEKPYSCEVCGKSFRVSYSLTLHLRTHTDIRPYVCATCNKRFKQQSVYVHHLKTHEPERNYKCDICGKCYRTAVQLCGHKNNHKKPFNCTECNRPFSSLYAVKIHMKTHSKGHKANKNLKNRCELCGASYARIFALRYHMKEQHGVEVHPGQLLNAEYSGNSRDDDDMESSSMLLNGVADANDAAISEQMKQFLSDDEEMDEETYMQMQNQIELKNRMNLQEQRDRDETEAATQALLQTVEETHDDNIHGEEIISNW